MVDKEFLYQADLEISRLEDVDKQLVSMHNYIENGIRQLKGSRRLVDYGNKDEMTSFAKILFSIQLEYRKRLRDLYAVSRNIANDIMEYSDWSNCLDEINYEQDKQEVDAWISNEKIFVRMPQVYAKVFYYKLMLPMQKGFFVNHSTIYEDFVRDSVEKLKEENREFFDNFVEKTITYLFVYDEASRMVDPDNNDTKSSLDAICSYLPYGDMAEYCTLSMMSRRSNTVEPGTYIVVSHGLESPVKSDNILKEIEQRYRNCSSNV